MAPLGGPEQNRRPRNRLYLMERMNGLEKSSVMIRKSGSSYSSETSACRGMTALMGNHDNYDMTQRLPQVEMFGSTVLKLSKAVLTPP